MSHTPLHLNVERHDLPVDAWATQVCTAQGRLVPGAQAAWMRARVAWGNVVDLDNGANFLDSPPDVLDALLDDIVAGWRPRGLRAEITLVPTDRDYRLEMVTDRADHQVVPGTTPDLARWATGGGTRWVISACPAPVAPPWL